MIRHAFFVLALFLVCGAPLQARDSYLSAAAEIGGRNLAMNGEATRTVWGFEVYKIRLYLHEVIRDAEKILAAKEHPKRIEIVMQRSVDEDQFSSTVQQSIDNNFTRRRKKSSPVS